MTETEIHDMGPFDADAHGHDAEGRPLNRYGRYEGQADDELRQAEIEADR
jgi:hypothetical protein